MVRSSVPPYSLQDNRNHPIPTREASYLHITLVGDYNPARSTPGGTRAYVEALHHYFHTSDISHTLIFAGREKTGEVCEVGVPVRQSNSSGHFLVSLATHLRSLGVPKDAIVHVPRPDYLLPFLATGVGRSFVCTLHGNPYRAMIERGHRFHLPVYPLAEPLLLRRTDAVVATDLHTASDYAGRYPWIRQRLRFIPNGVDTSTFRPMDKTAAKQRWNLGGTVFLYAGRLSPEKRVVEIMRSFRLLPEPTARLVIAGDGPERDRILRQAEDPRIQILGVVDRTDMSGLINASDAVVLYSTREGLPAIALEALACGVPVITTPVGGLATLVRPGKDGLLVSNIEELVEAMARIVAGARFHVSDILASVQDYDWSRVGSQLLDVYRGLAYAQ